MKRSNDDPLDLYAYNYVLDNIDSVNSGLVSIHTHRTFSLSLSLKNKNPNAFLRPLKFNLLIEF